MSTDAKLFFDAWTARTFAADLPWTDLYPTPLAALTDLLAEATLAGVDEDDIRTAVGDPVAALLAAMLDAPAPDAARFGAMPDGEAARAAATAMELALSYNDGLRDAVGSDGSLAASLMLQYLARQGFVLRQIGEPPSRLGALGPLPSDHPAPSWRPARPQ